MVHSRKGWFRVHSLWGDPFVCDFRDVLQGIQGPAKKGQSLNPKPYTVNPKLCPKP